MTNRNVNKSSPGQPAGQGSAGDAAPQPPTLSPQPPRKYEAPAQQQALSQDPRRRLDEGTPGPAAPPAERMLQWGEPRPRRRQDREAGPSDKQVYVPPVTLPPNREHQAMDTQKIQVAPSLLKGVDERNRPTMRRIPVQPGMLGAPPPGAPDAQGGARPGAVRTARVGIGSGVWPPPEDESPGIRGQPSRKQRPHAAAIPQPAAAVPRAGLPPNAARQDPTAATAAATAAALAARRRHAPLGLFALLVFLGSATVAGFWVLWRAANNPVSHPDTTLPEDVRAPAPEPAVAMPAPSTLPAAPPAVEPTVEPQPPVVEPQGPAASASPVAAASASPALPGTVAAVRPPASRPGPVKRPPPRSSAAPEDPYATIVSEPMPPPVLPSATSALPSTPPGTTAPPRPF